jgi:ubiquinone/menaquinone biosynthesis C-methylase UbiE
MPKPFQDLLPVYPLIAQQILDDYQISSGKCLDIGTGHGYLGIELARITDMEMYFVDLDPEALKISQENAVEAELDNVLHFVGADVCALPFEDDFADLIISRGSIWFWEDQAKGVQEIYRVLKTGGIGFIGGGLGRYTPPAMRERLKGKRRKAREEQGQSKFLDESELIDLLKKCGISNYRIIRDVEDEPGSWMEVKK